MDIIRDFGSFIGSILKSFVWLTIFIICFTIYLVLSNFLEMVIFGSTCMAFYLVYKGSNIYFDYLKKKHDI
jgi:uncharacterized membrane protein YesL